VSTGLLIGFFKALLNELGEPALVDGATRTKALVKILLPLGRRASSPR
jgi:ABC-type maltose transport system permease subunit